jgi:D-beta-D-heptose 7-phosphate kinase/D-beta-D-heptose 1-phosphate adenosyltransferase
VVQPSSGLTSIVISDYNKGLFNQRTAAHLLQCARAINVPVFVDTKPVNVPLYRGATLLKLNLEEARQCMDRLHIVHPALAAAAQPSSEDLAQLAATTLLGHYGFGAVVITRHSDGASYAVAGPLPPGQSVLPTHHVACTAQRVYDVSGAGDTFLAALAVASADKMSFEAAVRFANTASGIAVQYHGTARVSRVEVDEAVYRNGGVAAKVMDDAALLRLVSRRREADRSIVLANGCFDLLHAGHISLLERAARFGGVLVVAVNDDASLRQLKGQDRPFVPLDDRLRHLASLSSVDAVVVFDGDAEALVRRVKPDVLVKGGDTDCVAGADYVASQGGRVELLPVTIVAHSTNLRKGD